MTDPGEKARCAGRGTTVTRVKADLAAIRTACDGHVARAATIVGIGASTFGNAQRGHAAIRDGVLQALYGNAGATLLPHLAALLRPAKKTAPAVPAEVEAQSEPEQAPADGADAAASTLTEAPPAATPVTLRIITDVPPPLSAATLESLTVAAMIARTKARLECIDAEIEAMNARHRELFAENEQLLDFLTSVGRVSAKLFSVEVAA